MGSENQRDHDKEPRPKLSLTVSTSKRSKGMEKQMEISRRFRLNSLGSELVVKALGLGGKHLGSGEGIYYISYCLRLRFYGAKVGNLTKYVS